MKIAVIDNYDSFVYNIIRYFKESSKSDVIVMRNNEVDYSELDKCDAILLSPGPGIPSEAGDLLKIIQKYGTNKKILGICLGHQAIAEVFGGKLEQCLEPIHGRSSLIQHFDNDPLFRGISPNFDVGRYHSWKVNSIIPNELIVTAQTNTGDIMAIKHRDFNIRGIQFHPESILTPQGRKIIENWVSLVKN
ncbi:MAG: aminodeoxychorismate/anthranilate synthase component II [Flavobacteriia bacterium]|nr:aminodeoxychorismate/anthranilate synthase component II [Flavobacteriia bacterium]